MTVIFYALIAFFLMSGLIWLFLVTPAARLAGIFSKIAPLTIIAIGAALTIAGRGAFGIPLVALGLALMRRMRGFGQIRTPGGGQKSTVRTAALEMELDHETGEMDGRVLIGEWDGQYLSALGEEQLIELYMVVHEDGESAALLETYLDRRSPGWREDTNTHSGEGKGSPSGSGTMTKQEAYQVLGLEPGASRREIQAAWRKLMKSMHPDSGGSEFLAAKINAAKDVLLD